MNFVSKDETFFRRMPPQRDDAAGVKGLRKLSGGVRSVTGAQAIMAAALTAVQQSGGR
jgi:hypothetical protein